MRIKKIHTIVQVNTYIIKIERRNDSMEIDKIELMYKCVSVIDDINEHGDIYSESLIKIFQISEISQYQDILDYIKDKNKLIEYLETMVSELKDTL